MAATRPVTTTASTRRRTPKKARLVEDDTSWLATLHAAQDKLMLDLVKRVLAA